MISNEEKESWYYVAVKILSALLKVAFYYLNYLHSITAENKLKLHEQVCKNKAFTRIVILPEKDNVK